MLTCIMTVLVLVTATDAADAADAVLCCLVLSCAVLCCFVLFCAVLSKRMRALISHTLRVLFKPTFFFNSVSFAGTTPCWHPLMWT
jgi:hypothetical protein